MGASLRQICSGPDTVWSLYLMLLDCTSSTMRESHTAFTLNMLLLE